jgi:hypothetical protein
MLRESQSGEFMMVSDPPLWIDSLLNRYPRLQSQLRQTPHIAVQLQENTLTLFPNVSEDQTVDVFEWRLYLELLKLIARAVELF